MALKDKTTETESERELLIVRELDAPARLVFKAFSAPEHVLRWFGPKGFPLALCEMDFRVGGKYRFAMKGPDGRLMPAFGGEYLAIEEGKHLSYTNTMELPGAETMIITVTLEERAERTTLRLHTLFASVAMKRLHVERGYEQGVGSGLDQLADVVRELQSA